MNKFNLEKYDGLCKSINKIGTFGKSLKNLDLIFLGYRDLVDLIKVS